MWNLKGHYDLKLGSESFFMVIFTHRNEYAIVIESESYFFNAVGLYMRPWKENFSLEKVNFKEASVWIRLFSLLQEYWDLEILEGISNTLGRFVKVLKETL